MLFRNLKRIKELTSSIFFSKDVEIDRRIWSKISWARKTPGERYVGKLEAKSRKFACGLTNAPVLIEYCVFWRSPFSFPLRCFLLWRMLFFHSVEKSKKNSLDSESISDFALRETHQSRLLYSFKEYKMVWISFFILRQNI